MSNVFLAIVRVITGITISVLPLLVQAIFKININENLLSILFFVFQAIGITVATRLKVPSESSDRLRIRSMGSRRMNSSFGQIAMEETLSDYFRDQDSLNVQIPKDHSVPKIGDIVVIAIMKQTWKNFTLYRVENFLFAPDTGTESQVAILKPLFVKADYYINVRLMCLNVVYSAEHPAKSKKVHDVEAVHMEEE